MEFNAQAIADLAVPVEKVEIDVLTNDIREKAQSPLQNGLPADFNPTNNYYFGDNVAAPVKGSLTVSNYNVEDAYQRLNDGTYVAKFDTYKAGRNNYDYAAQTQSTTDKWLNGVSKFFTKTGTAVLGGTAGTIYGVGKWAEDGSLTSLYDNDFSRTLDDWNTKLDYKLPNYYTQQESEKNLFGQALTANFWADKVLGGLSFTAGAIISEGIWAYATGGSSLGSAAARWGAKSLGFTKVAKGLATYKGLLRQPLLNAYRAGQISKNTALTLGKLGDAANTVRFALTSAGYEASVEALQYKNEARENFYSNFEQLNGRAPQETEVKEFEDNLSSSANAVFGFNMAIVGSSNLVTLGRIFDLRSPIKTGIGNFIEKKAFGRGITSTIDDAGKVVYAPIKATTAQKVARTIYDYGRIPLVEGLYEEGLQGVTQKGANKWIEYSYDPRFATENVEAAGLVYESLAEQYGTREGWVDIGVGMIIGAIGGTVSARSQNRRNQAQTEYEIAGLNTFQGGKVIAERMLMANRISGFSEEAAQETENGNIVRSRIATDGIFHSYLNHKFQLGEDVLDAVNETQAALNGMTVEQFREAGVTEENIDSFKKDVIEEYTSVANQFKKNRKFAEYIIGTNRVRGISEVLQAGEQALNNQSQEALIQSLTWTLTAGENASRLMSDIQSTIATEVGAEQSNVLNVVQQLSKQQASKRGQLTKTIKKQKALTEERDRLQNSLIEVQNSPNETEGNRIQGEKLGQLNLRLIEVEKQIADYTNQIQSFTDELNSQRQYGQDVQEIKLDQISDFSFISVDDLTNLDENLQKFRQLVESYKTVNPQRYQYLTDLLDEYSQAHDVFNVNQSTALAISSGAIKIKNLNTWLGRKLEKGSLEEVTKDWLTDILTNYEANKVSTLANSLQDEVIPDEVWQEFTENNTTPQELIDSIAGKTILTAREQAIYDANKQQIDDIRKETAAPNPQPAYEEIIRNLAQDNYLLTHITSEQDALNIFNSNLTYSLGNGLSSTTTLLGANGVNEQLSQILRGQSPVRGQSGMVIFGIPKSFFNQEKVTSEDIENYIIENYPESIGRDLSIPREFNIAYFTNGQLTVKNQNSPAAQLRERLNNLLKTNYNSLTYIGSNYDEISMTKPAKAEIEEFRRNPENEELRQKLGNWRLLDSAVTGENQSIADLIDLISQVEQTIETEDVQDELMPEDIATVVSTQEERSSDTSVVRYDLAQNTLGSVTVKAINDKYRFSHLKMNSIINALAIPFNSDRLKVSVDGKVLKKVTSTTFENYKPGTVFYIDNIKITVAQGNTLEISRQDFLGMQDTLNLYIITPNINWSYADVYERVGDQMQKRPSDFQEDINPSLIYEIRPEDNLTLQIADDSYNRQLRDRVLNEEMSENLEKEILNSLKIYVMFRGQAVSTLKGLTNVAPNDNFLLLRETAKQAFIANPNTATINAQVKAKKIFLGSPQITQENIELDATAAQQVVSTGYSENGRLTLSRELQDVDTTYLSGFTNKAQKIPVVIFKKGKYNVAYPVTLRKSSAPMSDRVISIVENQTLSPTEKIKAINEQIIATGIAADKRLTEYNEQQIDSIIKDFAENQVFVSMRDFSNSNYRLASVQQDVLINIDLNNLSKTISDAKVELDLNTIEVSLKPQSKYDTLVQVEDRLSELAIELNRDYTLNAQDKYINSRGEIIEDTTYTNVIDEGTIITNPQNHLEKIRNSRAIEKMFSEKLPKIVKSALSPQVIEEIEYLLKKRNLFANQTQVDRTQVDKIIDENSCN